MQSQIEGGAILRANADRLGVRQEVVNLLSNAITYNREGGQVDIGVSAAGPSAHIVVHDTGLGSDFTVVLPSITLAPEATTIAEFTARN